MEKARFEKIYGITERGDPRYDLFYKNFIQQTKEEQMRFNKIWWWNSIKLIKLDIRRHWSKLFQKTNLF